MGQAGSGAETRATYFEDVTDYQEITPFERKHDIKITEGSQQPFCYRREPSFESELQSAPQSDYSLSLDNIIYKPRKCKYRTRYIPGYSPYQHLARCEAIERERSNRRWSLVYIVLGALLTVAGALAIKLIFG